MQVLGGGQYLKRGVWTICRFNGGQWQEREGGLFESGVDTPIHTMPVIFVVTNSLYPTILIKLSLLPKLLGNSLDKRF